MHPSIWLVLGISGLAVLFVVVCAICTWLWPCSSHGPVFHPATKFTGPSPGIVECSRCGAKWKEVVAAYQPIVADGDTVYEMVRIE